MICPNCGSDTSSEQAFCANCGAFVRSEFGRIISQQEASAARPAAADRDLWPETVSDATRLDTIDWPTVEDELRAPEPPAGLWPSETVFVPTAEPDVEMPSGEVAAAVDGVFEDAQADDFFEQSLSGKIKREDLEAELDAEPNAEPDDDAPAAALETLEEVPPELLIHVTQPEEDPHVTSANGTAPRIVAAAKAQPAPQTRPRRSILRGALKTLGIVLLTAAAFAGGVYLGDRMQPLALRSTPVPVLPPVAESSLPQPPSGMVYVPGGEFLMGRDLGDPLSRPAHKVTVEPFFIDATEVTNEAYAAFISATGKTPPLAWKDGKYPQEEARFPVTGVNWYDAAEFAAWAGKRLPTEAEWEFAARAGDGRAFPWGDEWDASAGNVAGASGGVREVGGGRASRFGAFDMAGNAWEWTATDARRYPGGREVPWSRLRLKIIRGGNWQSDQRSAAATFRGFYGADGERSYAGTGFRCVKDAR